MRSEGAMTVAETPTAHSTFNMERDYPAAPERVFAAFSEPARKRRWFVETGGHDVQEFEMDFRVGGRERSRFLFKGGSPVAGLACVNDSTFLDIVPNRRVVSASSMTIGGKRISASLVTVELRTNGTGTRLSLTHQGAFFEGADGPEMREAGWRKLIEYLAAELDR